jgi:hypothetical protein
LAGLNTKYFSFLLKHQAPERDKKPQAFRVS